MKLAGINYRDQAEDLRGAQLLVPVEDRLPLDPGEFHVDDLVGLSVVVQADKIELGTITNVLSTVHDLLEVTLSKQDNEQTTESAEETQTEDKHDSLRAKAAEKLRRKAKRAKKKKKPKTLLIPFVEDIVPVVDIEAGLIEITPPAGLIDL